MLEKGERLDRPDLAVQPPAPALGQVRPIGPAQASIIVGTGCRIGRHRVHPPSILGCHRRGTHHSGETQQCGGVQPPSAGHTHRGQSADPQIGRADQQTVRQQTAEYTVRFPLVPMALPLTSRIGPLPLPLTPLVISAVFRFLSARTQASLIRYHVQGLSLVSIPQFLPLTSSIELSQVRGSVAAVTDTVGIRALIASCLDLALLFPFLPSMYMTLQWSLDTSTSLWYTTVIRPTPLVAENRRSVGPMPPTLTTRTDDGRSLR